ncbi:response regulator [Nesterenkonia halotolerans]|uniref:DNA-binding NarL/FixJ family response regulator n=1 Tax=Nesterenkonia halotolerans TaxID=225325 RepID=A0ABR9J9D7_9MICC|nr:response regulator transcription factor [Nesterenkonia halotolerans]MBE1515611.1 DNA-binding NarL/FixJ family response regulator [Nesterenkonia halotolerans]
MTAAPVGEEVSVLIVDDEALMRAGLRLMIEGADGIVVVGEATDGSEVPAAVDRLNPDVILMDIRMPVLNGIDATRVLRQAGSRAQVVILTAFDTDTLLRDALVEGAVSFLLKDAEPKLVVQTIHDAARGRSSFSPKSLARLVEMATSAPGPSAAPEAERVRIGVDMSRLVTDREWEVGRFVAQGMTNSEIAEAMYLSATTVKSHLSSLFAKLQVTNRVQLAICVLERGTPG